MLDNFLTHRSPALEKLDMSSNQLTAIAMQNRPKDDWLPLVSLKELYLGNNRITEIANLDLLAELETLDLS